MLFDLATGESFNPLIYRASTDALEERISLVNGSKILNKSQKKWIDDFQLSLQDDISTNQRAAVTENLRLLFERQLDPSKTNFAQPWQNLTAPVRGEMQFSVTNVSRRLRALETVSYTHLPSPRDS